MVSGYGWAEEAVAVEPVLPEPGVVSEHPSPPPAEIPVATPLSEPVPAPAPESASAPINPPAQPLWDGVHQLPDGSTVTIKSGIVIPNSHAEEPPAPATVNKAKVVQSEPWEGQPIVGDSPCQQLVAQVCGRQDQCAASSACSLARQSLKLEQEERSHSWGTKAQGWGNIEYMTPTSGQCLASLKDQEFFKACGQ